MVSDRIKVLQSKLEMFSRGELPKGETRLLQEGHDAHARKEQAQTAQKDNKLQSQLSVVQDSARHHASDRARARNRPAKEENSDQFDVEADEEDEQVAGKKYYGVPPAIADRWEEIRAAEKKQLLFQRKTCVYPPEDPTKGSFFVRNMQEPPRS